MADLFDPRILIVGAGAIGASVAGFVAGHDPHLALYGRGPGFEAIAERGVTLFRADRPDEREVVPVPVVRDLEEAREADVVLFAVKTFQLEEAARQVKAVLGDRPVVVGLQNGVANQRILPRFFPQSIYGVVCYNAWTEAPDVVGYQKRGPIVLGTPEGTLQREAGAIARVLTLGVDTVVTDRFQDAAHSKIVLNLASAVTTLVGHGARPIEDRRGLQALLGEVLTEGVRIVRAAGYRESRLGGMPSWRLLWALDRLPGVVTAPLFEWNLKKMVRSSMAQDLARRPGGPTELDVINGHVIALADRVGDPAPANRALYELCQEAFARTPFEPLDVATVRAAIARRRKAA